MGLREQAKLDARAILEDTSGFAWPVTLTSPLGVATSLLGFTTDVGQTIDPETGQAVAGRRASCTVPRAALPALPEAVAESSRRPWLATFDDSQGRTGAWKVIEVLPDAALGVVVLLLEVYARVVTVSGAMGLPALQLSGAIVPQVEVSGAMGLPALQLSGAIVPQVEVSGAMGLPALRLSGELAVAAGVLGAMYRMGSSSAVGGEWQTIIDVLGGAALVQNDTDRRLAASTSANALPIGIYDGSDCMRMPLHAGNFNSSKYGIALWLRPADLGTQYIFSIISTDAGLTSLIFGITTGGALWAEIYIGGNFSGRHYETAAGVVSLNVWSFLRLQFDATLTDEFDATGSNANAKLRIFVGEVARALTAASFGGGGSPTALRTPNLTTGAAIFGGVSDSDTPPGAIADLTRHGPCTYVFVATPTAQQAANIMAFEAPT